MTNSPSNEEMLSRIENLPAEVIKKKLVQMFDDEKFAESIQNLPAEQIKPKLIQFLSESIYK